MVGPGKYDPICTQAREAAKAEGAILMVVHGEHGDGFACQIPTYMLHQIPAVLRQLADGIERDLSHQSLVAGVSQDPRKQ